MTNSRIEYIQKTSIFDLAAEMIPEFARYDYISVNQQRYNLPRYNDKNNEKEIAAFELMADVHAEIFDEDTLSFSDEYIQKQLQNELSRMRTTVTEGWEKLEDGTLVKTFNGLGECVDTVNMLEHLANGYVSSDDVAIDYDYSDDHKTVLLMPQEFENGLTLADIIEREKPGINFTKEIKMSEANDNNYALNQQAHDKRHQQLVSGWEADDRGRLTKRFDSALEKRNEMPLISAMVENRMGDGQSALLKHNADDGSVLSLTIEPVTFSDGTTLQELFAREKNTPDNTMTGEAFPAAQKKQR